MSNIGVWLGKLSEECQLTPNPLKQGISPSLGHKLPELLQYLSVNKPLGSVVTNDPNRVGLGHHQCLVSSTKSAESGVVDGGLAPCY